jgi:hypothetical protein
LLFTQRCKVKRLNFERLNAEKIQRGCRGGGGYKYEIKNWNPTWRAYFPSLSKNVIIVVILEIIVKVKYNCINIH